MKTKNYSEGRETTRNINATNGLHQDADGANPGELTRNI
jgi:hypothetical protein